MGRKVLIVGGVAGGASAAARLRRLDEEAEIIMFEKGQYISYANCGLPYHIGEVIKDKESLVVQTPERLRSKFNIDVRINSEVMKINRKEKSVEVYDRAHDRAYTETYDKLILSPGASPVKPDIKGVDSDRVFTLRNIPDTLKIKDFVDRNKPRRAVLAGAGYIGLEVAENLYRRGARITVVELAEHVIGQLDFEMAAIVHQHLKSKDVELYLNDAVQEFRTEDDYLIVKLRSGRELKADMAVLGIGVKPENDLAIRAQLEIGKRGGIVVDEYLRTSDEDIYAVGDAIEVTDTISGNKVQMPLAGPANRQGRTAADNIAGREVKYPGTQGTSIVKIFDITVATTGNSEAALKKQGVEYEKSFTHSGSHAGYYPGAIPMSIKLIFGKKDGRILGAQIIGYEGVDKRIDVIATAIYAKLTVGDLGRLELAYAPPYSSAKDPVNIAGYVASNIQKGDLEIFHWDKVKDIDMDTSIILDVRPEVEYSLHHLDGAVNIPVEQLRDRLGEIPKDKGIYIYCNTGLNAYFAYRMLRLNGYDKVWNLSGSLKTYDLTTVKQSNEDIYEYDKIMKNDEFVSTGRNDAELPAEADLRIDACGLQCPGPILQVYENINRIGYGEVLHVTASDPGFEKDIRVWCETTGNRLVGFRYEDRVFHAYIKKQLPVETTPAAKSSSDKTIVVLSGELDKAIAAFVIANGAVSMGRRVTMFFTFWGINILRKHEKIKVKKDILARMFSAMMPRGSMKAKLSKMSIGGIGGRLIRHIMKKNNIDSLEELMRSAMKNGATLIACTMTMDLMGIKKEELIDGIEFGGTASFLGAAEKSDTTLFIS